MTTQASEAAVERISRSILVVRASSDELAHRFGDLEAQVEKRLTAHDEAIAAILSAIRLLLNPLVSKARAIGFTADLEDPDRQ
jgi:ATP-dependent Clp protease ATP-binding subunit ClpA